MPLCCCRVAWVGLLRSAVMGIVARHLFITLVLAAVVSPALANPPVTKGRKADIVPARSDLDGPASDSATLQASMSRFAQKMAAAPQPGAGAGAGVATPV